MPFDPAPIQPEVPVITNPWVVKHPKEAQALADLAAYVRTIPNHLWNFDNIRSNAVNHPCGTIGCALGHAPFVPSCAALGIRASASLQWVCSGDDEYSEPERALKMPARVSDSIFYGGPHSRSYRVPMEQVTQAMVADKIDHWLATGKLR